MDYADADALNCAIRALALRHRARAGELLGRLGLHPGQEWVLMELATNGPQIQCQLATAITCEPPSVTLMVRKLECAGYIRRTPSPTDRRATVVELTPAGEALAAELRSMWVALAEETLAGRTDPPARQIAALIAELAANLHRKARSRGSSA